MNPQTKPGEARDQLPRLVTILLLAVLLAGAFVVLRAFLVPIAWAGILVSTTWPIYRRTLVLLGGRQGLSAFSMTLLLALTIFGPAATIAWLLASEAHTLVAHAHELARTGPPELPAWIARLPWVGERIASHVRQAWEDPQALKQWLEDSEWLAENRSKVSSLAMITAGNVARNLAKTLLALLSSYFLYRHGELLIAQLRVVIERFSGARVRALIPTVGTTVKAVVYGILMTAIAQGTLAGIGFWFTGVTAPVLLGVATAFASLIPFGPPFVWLPCALWLLVTGRLVAGIVLLAWGTLVVSTIDNVLRPYFISQATQLPLLLIFFGVLGGANAFGLLGVFLGPVILVILLVLWREWAAEASPRRS